MIEKKKIELNFNKIRKIDSFRVRGLLPKSLRVLSGRSERSMAWASSKPNLLNVALTRAKELCFIIGDRNLWGRMPYFKDAVKILDRWSEA